MKKIIIAIVIVFLLAVGIYQGLLKKKGPAFASAEVVRGKIVQEVSETGQVEKGDKINLGFKAAGRIEEIYVEKGRIVEQGEMLAKLDTAELQVQLREAKSNLAATQAKLDKLLAGAGQEEIKVAQTKVGNEQIDLDTAKQDLESSYEDALNVLDDAYLKAYNSYNAADLVRITYFTSGDQEGLTVSENKGKIERAVSRIKSSLDEAKSTSTQEKIDSALSKAKTELSNISDGLRIIRETCEAPQYRSRVALTDKSSLDTQRTNINTVITNVVGSQQEISSAKSEVNSAEGQLQEAKDELALLLAPARQEDVDLYEAQVEEAKAKTEVLETEIQDSYLRSPARGQIVDVKKRAGELAQPALQDVVIVLLPEGVFYVKADIYEEDIVKIKTGNPVDISLIAFPEKTFKGKVISVDPAEKIKDGVVYYEIIIFFNEAPEGVQQGMTADLVITAASKENVLIIPKDAIQKKDDKSMVQVLREDLKEEREIKTGLLGSNDMVEVISGLEEGEKIILQ